MKVKNPNSSLEKSDQEEKKPIVKVAGCWELGANVPLIEFNWWDSPLQEFGVSEFYMFPVTGIDVYKNRIKTITNKNFF